MKLSTRGLLEQSPEARLLPEYWVLCSNSTLFLANKLTVIVEALIDGYGTEDFVLLFRICLYAYQFV